LICAIGLGAVIDGGRGRTVKPLSVVIVTIVLGLLAPRASAQTLQLYSTFDSHAGDADTDSITVTGGIRAALHNTIARNPADPAPSVLSLFEEPTFYYAILNQGAAAARAFASSKSKQSFSFAPGYEDAWLDAECHAGPFPVGAGLSNTEADVLAGVFGTAALMLNTHELQFDRDQNNPESHPGRIRIFASKAAGSSVIAISFEW
jgi:hypothetical protein